MHVLSFNCNGIKFDYYDSEQVLLRDIYPYYVTPKRLAQIEAWMIKENIEVINNKEQLEYCIDKGWITAY